MPIVQPMRVREGHVSSADGTSIRYQVIGSGRPLFCCNGLGVPTYFWRHLVAQFGGQFQIVCWDPRGHGHSALPSDPRQICYDDIIADGLAVLRHLDLTEAIGIGHSTGFQTLLGIYAQEGKRFDGLVSCLGTDGQCLSHFYDADASKALFNFLYLLTVFYPRPFGLLLDLFARTPLPYYFGGLIGLVDPEQKAYDEIRVYLDHFRRMDPHFFAALAQAAEAHSARPVLPQIKIPTLFIAAEDDKFVPLRIAEAMHRGVVQSELTIIPHGSHAALMERPLFFNQRLGQFLWKHRLHPDCATHTQATRSRTKSSRKRQRDL